MEDVNFLLLELAGRLFEKLGHSKVKACIHASTQVLGVLSIRVLRQVHQAFEGSEAAEAGSTRQPAQSRYVLASPLRSKPAHGESSSRRLVFFGGLPVPFRVWG